MLFANLAPLMKKHCHFPAASKAHDFCEAKDFQELSQHVDLDISAEVLQRRSRFSIALPSSTKLCKSFSQLQVAGKVHHS